MFAVCTCKFIAESGRVRYVKDLICAQPFQTIHPFPDTSEPRSLEFLIHYVLFVANIPAFCTRIICEFRVHATIYRVFVSKTYALPSLRPKYFQCQSYVRAVIE